MALYGQVVADNTTSFRNKFINGDFSVWQRGTSFSSSSVNEYSADRWRTEGYGHNSVISRQTFTVGQTDVPGYPTYFCRVASSTTVSSGQFWSFQQRVEAPQVMSGYGTYTLSFWVKSTTSVAAGAFSYGINGVQSLSPALTTSWQKITTTVSITNNESNGYVSTYLVYFTPGKGNITVDIANAQLEYGSVATPFERRPYGTELALCQRYYYQSATISFFYFAGAGQSHSPIIFPVVMRTNPTVVYYPTQADLLAKTNAGNCTQDGTGIVSVAQVNGGPDTDSAFKTQQGSNMRVARTCTAEL